MNVELGAKQLELLHEVVPTATKIALLVNPTSPALADPLSRQLQAAAESSRAQASGRAGEQLRRTRGGVCLPARAASRRAGDRLRSILEQPQRADRRVRAAQRDADHASVSRVSRRWRSDGLRGSHHRFISSGRECGRILKGEKPAELPVQGPTKYELAINLRTAKALGLDVSSTLLARADEVIE